MWTTHSDNNQQRSGITNQTIYLDIVESQITFLISNKSNEIDLLQIKRLGQQTWLG